MRMKRKFLKIVLVLVAVAAGLFLLITNRFTEIVIHCTATPEGQPCTVEQIAQWHKARGFLGIGYHYVIYLDGSIHKGRSTMMFGAHCKGHNFRSIGICYVGGVTAGGKSKDTRTPAQKEALRELVAKLKKRYPWVTVHGHNEFARKDCPCFDVSKEFGE